MNTTHISKLAAKFLADAQQLGSNGIQGIGCTRIAEDFPEYDDAPCEKVLKGNNNSYIVLGRDKPAGSFSGCGGRGDTQCAMIDLVAGRASSTIMANLGTKNELNDQVVVDSNFFSDAARVYLTQRAINIDDYLGFARKKTQSTELSAAVVKSDCTRIVGRESVRIYAGGGRADGFGTFGEPRSDNSDINNPRIELIVGNQGEDDMQPAVLGYNLKSYLQTNNQIQDGVLKILQSLILQISANTATLVPFTAGAYTAQAIWGTAENTESLSDMATRLYNQALNDMKHLDEAIVPGSKSVLSKKVYIT